MKKRNKKLGKSACGKGTAALAEEENLLKTRSQISCKTNSNNRKLGAKYTLDKWFGDRQNNRVCGKRLSQLTRTPGQRDDRYIIEFANFGTWQPSPTTRLINRIIRQHIAIRIVNQTGFGL